MRARAASSNSGSSRKADGSQNGLLGLCTCVASCARRSRRPATACPKRPVPARIPDRSRGFGLDVNTTEKCIRQLLRRTEKLGYFQQAGSENDRRAEQERKLRCFLLVESTGSRGNPWSGRCAKSPESTRQPAPGPPGKRLPKRQFLRRFVGARALQAITEPQQQSVGDQRDGDDPQIVENDFQPLLQQQPDDARRDGADDQRPLEVAERSSSDALDSAPKKPRTSATQRCRK